MMYRETGKTEYLEQARKVASYIKNHPNLPDDKIPYWDFDAPDIPAAPRDASAAAVMASGLIELSQLDKSKEGADWLELAEMQIRSLSSPEYLAEPETNGGFILKHSVGNYNKNSEVDVPCLMQIIIMSRLCYDLKNYRMRTRNCLLIAFCLFFCVENCMLSPQVVRTVCTGCRL